MSVMAATPTHSNVPIPSAKALRSFNLGMVKPNRPVRWFLERGSSLAICCKYCRRLVEWTPADLEARFGGRLDLEMRDIAEKLACSGEACGSHDIAVFPHPYAGAWSWPRD
jgi:hypothetical protein